MRFVKFSTLIFLLILTTKIFGQTNKKINPNPVAVALVNKVIKNSNLAAINGGHKTGNLYGKSIFNFLYFSSQSPMINVTYTVSDMYGRLMRATEEGMLRNFSFQNNGGAFNTKIIFADWGPSSNSKYGKFAFYLDEEKDDIIIQIYSESNWKHSVRIPLSVQQYQDIVNQLTISGSPINILNERLKKQVRDSIENAKKDSILKVEMTEKPLKINDIYVAQKSFSATLTWQQAKEACEKLGNGWRMPRIKDLNALSNYFIGGNNQRYPCERYWSSTIFSADTSEAYFFNICFSNRDTILVNRKIKESHTKKSEQWFALAIWSPYSEFQRDSIERVAFISDSTQKAIDSIAVVEKINREREAKRIEKEKFINGIIGQPVLFNGLLVAQFDLPNNMNLEDAKKACKNLGDGWRLPTAAELSLIIKEGKEVNISNFEFGKYWCSDIEEVAPYFDEARIWRDGKTYKFVLFKGKSIIYTTKINESEYKIRAVKTQ